MCRQTTESKNSNAGVTSKLVAAGSSTSNEISNATIPTNHSVLPEGEAWLKTFDMEAFTSEIAALGKKLEKEQGTADVQHLFKMIRWSNLFALIGFLAMGWSVNLVAVVGISTFTFSRWTMIAHHTCHGGYDKTDAGKNCGRYHRFRFALGSAWNRFCDWFDWMMPEAWNVEHNNRHHYNLSEVDDPDLVEMNLSFLRELKIPTEIKYVIVAFFMLTWKWFYYAPNTYKELKLAKLRREGRPMPPKVNPEDAVTIKSLVEGTNPFYSFWEFLTVVVGPYLVIHFFLTPLPYLLLGHVMFDHQQKGDVEFLQAFPLSAPSQLYWTAVTNMFLAELLTNAHGFLAVVTNHAGDDMYRFRKGCRPFSGSFYLRQVLASVDYDMGTNPVDFFHGWLNYQIEHHMWPNLSMLSYQKAAPLVQDICRRHGVPYIKQNVFLRLKKTVDIMVGNTSMKWFPEDYEQKFLEKDAVMETQKKQASMSTKPPVVEKSS